MFFETKVVAVNVCNLTQNIHGLFSYFRSNSVTGKDYDAQLHDFS